MTQQPQQPQRQQPQISRSGVRVRGFDDPELDFQLVRQLGVATSGGSSIGETLIAAAEIREQGEGSWTKVFNALAERQLADADGRAAAGHGISARDQYLKACNSFRSAEYFSPPGAEATMALGRATRAAFLKGLDAGGIGYEELSVMFEGTELPGLVIRAPEPVKTGRLLIAISGFDGTMEESYLQAGCFGLERGWDVMLVAGPGQADTRRADPDSTFIPDTDRWVTPWLDQARELAGVDVGKIAILGISYGGYFVLRAAAAESRFAALVANSPILDLHAYNMAFVGFDPEQVLGEQNDFGIADLASIPDEAVPPSMKDLARAQIARFGQSTFVGTYRFLREFTVDPADVTVPALGMVGTGEGPVPNRQYDEFLARAGGPVSGHRFSDDEAGAAHCQLDNLRFGAAVMYDWLDETVPA
jgi:pimeloyl-ACP methyl ester carboxylesterase